MIPLILVTLAAATWVMALQIDSQAAIAGAVVMTFSVLGVLIIYWVLTLTQRR